MENFKDCLNTNDGIKTTKLLQYTTNIFKSNNYLMLNINEFSVFNKQTKGAVNEKLTGQTKNFGQFPIPKKSSSFVPKNIFGSLIRRNR